VRSSLENARCFLRSHRLGRLVATLPDGLETRAEDCHFVICGRSGHLIFSVTTVMLELEDHVICIPDERRFDGEGVLELGVALAHEPAVPPALRERHLAYHGIIRGGVWVQVLIRTARFGEAVIDGEDIRVVNGLIDAEPALCRLCNRSGERLARAARQKFGLIGSDVRAVGVDCCGIDLRVGHRVMRVEFADEALTEAQAATEIESFLLLGDER
jgi:hypothetical protein